MFIHCKRPITQLQIPKTDISCNSSTESIYETAYSNNSSRQNSMWSQKSREHNNNKINGSPNMSLGNGNVTSKLLQVNKHSIPVVFNKPSGLTQTVEYYTPHKIPSITSSKTRRPKPASK
jgi:hypothetical protein